MTGLLRACAGATLTLLFTAGGLVRAATPAATSAATPDDCQTLRKHGHRAEAQGCYQSLAQSREPYLRA